MMTQEKFQRDVKNKLKGICDDIDVKMEDLKHGERSVDSSNNENVSQCKRNRRKCAPSKQYASALVDSNNNSDSSTTHFTTEVIDIEEECVKAKHSTASTTKRKKTSLDQLLSRAVAKKQKIEQEKTENIIRYPQENEIVGHGQENGQKHNLNDSIKSSTLQPVHKTARTIQSTPRMDSVESREENAGEEKWYQRPSSPAFRKRFDPYSYYVHPKHVFSHPNHEYQKDERSPSPPVKYHVERRRFRRSRSPPTEKFRKYLDYEHSKNARSKYEGQIEKLSSPGSKHREYRAFVERPKSPNVKREVFESPSEYTQLGRSLSPGGEYVENSTTTVLRPKARRISTPSTLPQKHFYPANSPVYPPKPSAQSREGSVWSPTATISNEVPRSPIADQAAPTCSKGRSSKFFPPNKRQVTTNQRYAKLNNTQLQRRLVANARERSRVHALSNAFDALRGAIPSYSVDQKLSKLTILRVAINYIDALTQLLAPKTPTTQKRFEKCVDECSSVLQQEYGKSKNQIGSGRANGSNEQMH